MKRKLLCLLLALVLTAACVLPSYAAYSDTVGHWAAADIARATALGLFSGVSDTQFAPDQTMDRAMVVSVLSRLAKISTAEWSDWTNFLTYKFTDVKRSAYYSVPLAWAILHGIASGTSSTTFSPTKSVTREEIATMFCNFLDKEGYTLRNSGAAAPSFSDSSSISSWAKDSVTRLAKAGIIAGIDDGKGGVKFSPQKNATRAECASLFCRLYDAMMRSFTPTYATSVTLSSKKLTLDAGSSSTLTATLAPASATNKTVVWFSSDASVAKVNNSGKVTGVKAGTARIFAASDKAYAICEVTVNKAGAGLASSSMSYEEKCIFVFGKTLSGGENSGVWRTVYSTQAEAQANQVYITVPVWVVSNGQKVSSTRYFQIHKNLAATVQQIFQEIYDSPEKPAISAVGGWRWRSYETSEHNMGTALDLSPDANPYVYAGADPYSAGYRPGENPYSIPIGGTIDQIFAKYGFKRGIYWNSGNKDYMHYSFFGW